MPAWLLTYQRSRLAGIAVLQRLADGTELRAGGTGPTLTLSGPSGDVLLWLAGRPGTEVAVTADDPAALSAVGRLRV